MSAFSDADAIDMEKLGTVGTLSGNAAEYAPIWRIVKEAHIPLSDIEECWTFDRIISFGGYMEMNLDYRSAWGEYYQQKARENNG